MTDINAGQSEGYSLETVPHKIYGRELSYFMDSIMREVLKKLSIKGPLGQHGVK